MREFMRSLSLWAIDTFSDVNWQTDVGGWTWKSRGDAFRLDYVLAPLTWKHADTEVGIDRVALPTLIEDHRSVTAKIVVSLVDCAQRKPPETRMPFDGPTLCTAIGLEHSRYALASFLFEHRDQLWSYSSEELASFWNSHVERYLKATCPKIKKPARSSWISDSTHQVLALARTCRRQAARNIRKVRHGFLRHILMSWRSELNRHKFPHVQPCPPPHPKWLHYNSLATERLCQISRTLLPWALWALKQLRRDEAEFLKQRVQMHRQKFDQIEAGNLWDTIRHHLPKWKRRNQNRPLRYEQTQKAFLAHFAAIEDAQMMELSRVCEVTTSINSTACQAAHEVDFELQDIPTLFELENAIHEMQAGRASAGAIIPEILKASPHQMAIYFQAPMTWKGATFFLCRRR